MLNIKGIEYDFAFTVDKPNAYDTLKILRAKTKNKFEADYIEKCDVKLVYYSKNKKSIRFYLKKFIKKINLKKCNKVEISNAYAVIRNETFRLVPFN